MIPEDNVPINYTLNGALEKTVVNFEGQLIKTVGAISDWRNALTEAEQANISDAKINLSNMLQRVRRRIIEWEKLKRKLMIQYLDKVMLWKRLYPP